MPRTRVVYRSCTTRIGTLHTRYRIGTGTLNTRYRTGTVFLGICVATAPLYILESSLAPDLLFDIGFFA